MSRYKSLKFKLLKIKNTSILFKYQRKRQIKGNYHLLLKREGLTDLVN
jgi:hypothetical protein